MMLNSRRSLRIAVLPLLIAGLAACSTLGIGGDGKDDDATPTVGNRTPILSRISNEVKPDPTLASVSMPGRRRGSATTPAIALAAAVSGEARNVRPPLP